MKIPDNFKNINKSDMKVILHEGESSTHDKMKFTWEVTGFENGQMKIQLYFEDPQYISTLSVNS